MLTVKEITAKISGIRRSSKALRENTQTVLVNLAAHAYEHGDVRQVAPLLNALQGADKKAVTRYLSDHCFVNVSDDGKVKLNKSARNKADFADGTALIVALAEVPAWYEAVAATDGAKSAIDPAAKIKALAKQVSKGERDIKIDLLEIEAAYGELLNAIKIKRESESVLEAA